jgi:hypothetical protein
VNVPELLEIRNPFFSAGSLSCVTLITLGVRDLDRSIEFYEQGRGLCRKEGPDGIAFFETAGTLLALYPREKLA